MNTTYRRPIPSPFQPRGYQQRPFAEKRHYDVSESENPVREEIRKFCTAFDLSMKLESDDATLAQFKHVPGLIAILCTVRSNEGKVIGQGRGWATMNRMNRSIERSVYSAVNGAILSSMNNACKILDYIRLEAADDERDAEKRALGEAYRPRELDETDAPITEKQKSLLTELLHQRVSNDEERERRLSEIESLSKLDASEMISSLVETRR